ncbi:MAG: hypothetical protein ACKOOE_00985 [Micrococcales bacterium]
MAKFAEILHVIDSMNPKSVGAQVAQKRGRAFRAYLHKNHKVLYSFIYAPLAVLVLYGGFVGFTFVTAPKFGKFLAPSLGLIFGVCGVSIALCQFIGVSRFIDSGVMNLQDWDDD